MGFSLSTQIEGPGSYFFPIPMLRRETIEKEYRIKAIYLCVSSCLGLGWSVPGQV